MKRIAVARVWFEGNSFCPRLTTLQDFTMREWHDAASVDRFYAGSQTEIGGALEWRKRTAGLIDTHFLRCCAAPPGGPLAPGVLQTIVDDILAGIDRLQMIHRLDGVYLSLHGAMVAVDTADADLMLVQKVRQHIGPDCALALSFDLHANLDPALTELAQIVVGYKTYPHIDMRETGIKALDILHAAVLGLAEPLSVIAPIDKVLPSHLMATSGGPMAEIALEAAEITAEFDLLDATPFGGFAYADTRHTGGSVSVCIDGRQHAQARQLAVQAARKLAKAMLVRAPRFAPQLPDAPTGLARAFALLAQQDGGCVAVLDPADNPLSGGIGDTTALFHCLTAQPLTVQTVFAFFHDPHLVQRAVDAGVGAVLSAQLGGRVSDAYGAPAAFTGRVETLCNGRFVNDGPMERGLACDIGPSVVLRGVDQPMLRVVVCSQCQSPNDMAWVRLHNIDLTQVRLFCVKAKNHFRAAFASHLISIIDIDAPGPASLDLQSLPYQHVARERLRYCRHDAHHD